MPGNVTTVGHLLLREIIPKDISIPEKLDKKGMRKLFAEIAEKYPDKFPEISLRILSLGANVAYREGISIQWDELSPHYDLQRMLDDAHEEIYKILSDPKLSRKEKEKKIIELASKLDDYSLDESVKEMARRGGSIYIQYTSGARGKPVNMRRLIGSDVIYINHLGKPVPILVSRGVTRGLSPAEYWLATYGARKGWVTTQLGTADGGYLGKQLMRAAHRLVVVAPDGENKYGTIIGLPVPVDDPDNVGSLLAVDTDGFAKNTVLTPEILAKLKAKGFDEILIRSVAVRKDPSGGVYSRDIGVYEKGKPVSVGDMVGIIASQTAGEPITQMLVGAKHASGTIKGSVLSVDTLQQMLQVPQVYKGGITHSRVTGRVSRIEPGPAGGYFVFVEDEPHFVHSSNKVVVKVGDFIEAGDPLSDGIPNPSALVAYKGLGEGRRQYIELLRDAFSKLGHNIRRKNFEILSAGLLDHVIITRPYKNYLPGDVVNYSWIESIWEPRETAKKLPVDQAVWKYLEVPVLHFTIGTRLVPSFINKLKKFNITEVIVNDEPAPFDSHMVPAERVLNYDPDWVVRFLGGTEGIRKSLLRALYEGHVSDFKGTSFVPPLARGTPFATQWPANITPYAPKKEGG